MRCPSSQSLLKLSLVQKSFALNARSIGHLMMSFGFQEKVDQQKIQVAVSLKLLVSAVTTFDISQAQEKVQGALNQVMRG